MASGPASSMPSVQVSPWGKLDRQHPDRAWAPRLSLVGHSLDVAAVARALLALPTWRRRLERLAGQTFDPCTLDRLTVLAYLHDVGKAGAGFYSQGVAVDRQRAWMARTGAGREVWGHTRTVAPLLHEHLPAFDPHRQAVGLDAVRAWGGADRVSQEAVLDLWLAAVSHHGQPLSMASLCGVSATANASWTSTIDDYDPLHGLRELGAAARRLWPGAFAPDQPAWEPAEALIHAFAGVVSLADWIGSSTRFFPFDQGGQDHGRWGHAQLAAARALRDMRLDVESLRGDLRHRAPTFRDVFGFDPTAVQQGTAEQPPVSPLVLEAETGSGKTEAALWRFKTLFEQGEVDALCFLLPTRVAATGIGARIEAFVERLFPDPQRRPSTVLAIPGYLHANGVDGQPLAGYDMLWPDHDVGDALFWAAENTKRYFAGAAVASTIDQFLLSTLQTRHAHLRASLLLRSLVVVDEVHASDPYMRTLMLTALRRHLRAGGHALLLSATLTSDLRQQLVAAAPALPPAPGTRRQRIGTRDAAAAQPALRDDYPRLTAPGVTRVFGPSPVNKRIHHRLQPLMLDPGGAAALAAMAVHAGARVLVIRNTVRQAVATQRALQALLGADHPALFRCAGVVALHHGRYAFADRRRLDAEVGAQFGKSAAQSRRPVVLCATQTVEISVDCDADFLITDLVPMDVLLQRLGRLHRHAQRHGWRPKDHETAQCVVLTPASRDLAVLFNRQRPRGLGLGPQSAYPDLLTVEATWQALEDTTAYPTLDIPTHNRALVEGTCSAIAVHALAERLGPAWQQHRNDLWGLHGAQRSHALRQCIDWAQPWREATPGDLTADVRTRLGLDGIRLELPAPWQSPFGETVTALDVPAWMLPRRPDEASAIDAVKLPAATDWQLGRAALSFQVQGRGFTYDHLGLAAVEPAR